MKPVGADEAGCIAAALHGAGVRAVRAERYVEPSLPHASSSNAHLFSIILTVLEVISSTGCIGWSPTTPNLMYIKH